MGLSDIPFHSTSLARPPNPGLGLSTCAPCFAALVLPGTPDDNSVCPAQARWYVVLQPYHLGSSVKNSTQARLSDDRQAWWP